MNAASGIRWNTLPVAILIGAMLGGQAWAGPGSCDPAIPDPGPDQVFANLRPFEVAGLYATLWSFRARQTSGNGAVTETLNTNGHSISVSTRSWSCTNLRSGSAWDKSWSCTLEITGMIALHDLTYSNIMRGGEGASTITTLSLGPSDVSMTDILVVQETLTFLWDAGGHTLTVYTTYPGSTVARNHQRIWGRYAIAATTLAQTTSTSGDSAVGAQFSSPSYLYANVGPRQSGPTAYVNARIDGNPFWTDRGLFTFVRGPEANASCFIIGTEWGTDALADLSETAAAHTARCPDSYEHTARLSGRGLDNDIASFTSEGLSHAFADGSVEIPYCRTWSDLLIASLHFGAGDAFAPGCGVSGCGGEEVGLRSLAKINAVDQQNGICKRWYEVQSRMLVNWALYLQTGSGETGGGFDIGSGTSVPTWLSSEVFAANYACPDLAPPRSVQITGRTQDGALDEK